MPEAGVWLAWRRIRVDARRASDGGGFNALPQTGGPWQGVKMVPTAPPPAPADQPESKKQGCDVGTRQATLFQGVAKWGQPLVSCTG
jgi:hypothetical protein